MALPTVHIESNKIRAVFANEPMLGNAEGLSTLSQYRQTTAGIRCQAVQELLQLLCWCNDYVERKIQSSVVSVNWKP
jgi:hypothetical protein